MAQAIGTMVHYKLGHKLLDDLLKRDPTEGGRLLLAYGETGAGKSTFLGRLALRALDLGDIVVWRGRHRDQWPRLWREGAKVTLFVHKQDELRVFRGKFGTKNPEDITDQFGIVKYETVEEVLDELQPGRVNVVYSPTWYLPPEGIQLWLGLPAAHVEGPIWWYEFLKKLTERVEFSWYSVFIDEFHEIAPANPAGVWWKVIVRGQNVMNDLRGSFISLFAATHQYTHVDYRILQKFNWHAYLYGARVPKISSLQPKIQKVNWVQKGEAILEAMGAGLGGRVVFDEFEYDGYIYKITTKWTGEIKTLPEGEQGKPSTTNRGVYTKLREILRTQGLDAALAELEELFEMSQISPATFREYTMYLKKEAKNLGLF